MEKFKVHWNVCAKHEKSPVTHCIGMHLPTAGTEEATKLEELLESHSQCDSSLSSNRNSDYKE